MWRGMTSAKPIRTGASFVGLGTHRQRMVFYPISLPIQAPVWPIINWIAEITVKNNEGWKQADGSGKCARQFMHHFDNWDWDWLDVPGADGQADSAFENPMIDRDPVPTWRDGTVAAARRCGACHVSDRLERGQPGHRRCAHSRAQPWCSTASTQRALRRLR